MTAHDAFAGMPLLKENSDADLDDTNFNSKMPAQPARNENENLIEIGNGCSDLAKVWTKIGHADKKYKSGLITSLQIP
eukprot:11140830-Ditylum_brightwellii.AAC.1